MSTALARKYRVDLTSDLTLAGGWLQLNGINDLKPDIPPNIVDSSAYDTNGWGSSEVTLYNWSLTATVLRRLLAGVYDPGQELARARIGQFGDSVRCGVRWYEKSAAADAWQGVAIVKWERAQTGVADLDSATITFNGDGILTPITNPYSPTAVPTIVSATPSGVATGGLVTIIGSGFTGTVATTGVKFGATNATSWVVVSDSEIVAIMPAGSAGAANVVVTNATGASTAFAYTRG